MWGTKEPLEFWPKRKFGRNFSTEIEYSTFRLNLAFSAENGFGLISAENACFGQKPEYSEFGNFYQNVSYERVPKLASVVHQPSPPAHLDALVDVDDGADGVADDEDDDDGEEHHGDLVVAPLVRRDGVVQPRRLVDGAAEAGNVAKLRTTSLFTVIYYGSTFHTTLYAHSMPNCRSIVQ